MPTEEQLDELYAKAWRDPEAVDSGIGGTNDKIAAQYAEALAKSVHLPSFTGLRLLDFGAGRGNLARALEERGADVVAFDRYGAEHLARKKLTAVDSFGKLSGTFDGIVALDVIEHLAEPWTTLRELRKRLKPNGWAILATVNTCALRARVQGHHWKFLRHAPHVIFIPKDTLIRMSRECGFTSVKRVRWQIRYAANPITASIQTLLQLAGVDAELRLLCRS